MKARGRYLRTLRLLRAHLRSKERRHLSKRRINRLARQIAREERDGIYGLREELFDTTGPGWRPVVGERVFVVPTRRWGTVAEVFEAGARLALDGELGGTSWADVADLAPEPTSYRDPRTAS